MKWYELQELVEKVLVRMPIKNVFQARLVCKIWRDVTLSRSFKKFYTEHFGGHVLLVTDWDAELTLKGFPEQLLIFSDSSLAHYECVPAPSVHFVAEDEVLDYRSFEPMASAGGVVLYVAYMDSYTRDMESRYYELFICNIMTGWSMKLPPVLTVCQSDSPPYVLLTCESCPEIFKVLIIGFIPCDYPGGALISVHQYDSVIGVWKQFLIPDILPDETVFCKPSFIHSGNTLYIQCCYEGFVVYNTEDGSMQFNVIQGEPEVDNYIEAYAKCEQIFLHDGALLTVGISNRHNAEEILSISQLQLLSYDNIVFPEGAPEYAMYAVHELYHLQHGCKIMELLCNQSGDLLFILLTFQWENAGTSVQLHETFRRSALVVCNLKTKELRPIWAEKILKGDVKHGYDGDRLLLSFKPKLHD